MASLGLHAQKPAIDCKVPFCNITCVTNTVIHSQVLNARILGWPTCLDSLRATIVTPVQRRVYRGGRCCRNCCNFGPLTNWSCSAGTPAPITSSIVNGRIARRIDGLINQNIVASVPTMSHGGGDTGRTL